MAYALGALLIEKSIQKLRVKVTSGVLHCCLSFCVDRSHTPSTPLNDPVSATAKLCKQDTKKRRKGKQEKMGERKDEWDYR